MLAAPISLRIHDPPGPGPAGVPPTETVSALQAPTDGFIPPHDVQPIINGGVYRQTLPPGEKVRVTPGVQGVVGPVGFRLD